MVALTLSLPEEVCYLGESGLFSEIYYTNCSFINGMRTAFDTGMMLGGPESFLWARVRKLKDLTKGKSKLLEMVCQRIRYCKIKKNYDVSPKNPLADVLEIELTEAEKGLAYELCEKYHDMLKKDPDQFVRVLFEDVRILSGREIVLEKTPSHVFSMPLIWKVFPEAKIVFIHRHNKRAVLASYYLMTKQEKKLSAMAKRFEKISKLFERYQKMEQENIYTVWYEDVLEDPLQKFADIYKFAGFNFNENVKTKLKDIRPRPSKFEKLDESHKKLILSALNG
jgi:hypothetical protein